jgi:hypothetical protein
VQIIGEKIFTIWLILERIAGHFFTYKYFYILVGFNLNKYQEKEVKQRKKRVSFSNYYF